MNAAGVHSAALMGTIITIEVVGDPACSPDGAEQEAAIDQAFDWFRRVEATCSRFDERSELRQLSARSGTPVAVSALLFEALQFALAVSAETGGAFDPTVGRRMEERGFNRHYRTGLAAGAALAP
ncbi:MAG: FAD:protein FMN transferase, partial [Pseudomonadota bacterium]